jgi:hypothetical protein
MEYSTRTPNSKLTGFYLLIMSNNIYNYNYVYSTVNFHYHNYYDKLFIYLL